MDCEEETNNSEEKVGDFGELFLRNSDFDFLLLFHSSGTDLVVSGRTHSSILLQITIRTDWRMRVDMGTVIIV